MFFVNLQAYHDFWLRFDNLREGSSVFPGNQVKKDLQHLGLNILESKSGGHGFETRRVNQFKYWH